MWQPVVVWLCVAAVYSCPVPPCAVVSTGEHRGDGGQHGGGDCVGGGGGTGDHGSYQAGEVSHSHGNNITIITINNTITITSTLLSIIPLLSLVHAGIAVASTIRVSYYYTINTLPSSGTLGHSGRVQRKIKFQKEKFGSNSPQ